MHENPHSHETLQLSRLPLVVGAIAIIGTGGLIAIEGNLAEADSLRSKQIHHNKEHLGHNQPSPVLDHFPATISVYQNDQNGYPIGNLKGGDSIKDSGIRFVDNRGRRWLAGLMVHTHHLSDNECGWMLESKAQGIQKIFAKNVCANELPRIKHRSNILSDANGKRHQYGGGSLTPVPLKKICRKDSIYLNYDDAKHMAYDRLPIETNHGLHWRTKTVDHKKLFGQMQLDVTRHSTRKKVNIWVNVSSGCVYGPLPHDGPPNTDYLQTHHK